MSARSVYLCDSLARKRGPDQRHNILAVADQSEDFGSTIARDFEVKLKYAPSAIDVSRRPKLALNHAKRFECFYFVALCFGPERRKLRHFPPSTIENPPGRSICDSGNFVKLRNRINVGLLTGVPDGVSCMSREARHA